MVRIESSSRFYIDSSSGGALREEKDHLFRSLLLKFCECKWTNSFVRAVFGLRCVCIEKLWSIVAKVFARHCRKKGGGNSIISVSEILQIVFYSLDRTLHFCHFFFHLLFQFSYVFFYYCAVFMCTLHHQIIF